MLVGALRGVFASTREIASFVMPALLENLSSQIHAAKLDALQTFVACVEPRALDAAQRDNLAKPVAVDSHAKRNALGGAYDIAALLPFLAGLRGVLRSEIIATFDGSAVFARTHPCLAGTYLEIGAKATENSVRARIPQQGLGGKHVHAEVAVWASRALRCTTLLVSREADQHDAHTGGVRATIETLAFRRFVLPLVRLCVEDVLAAPHTLDGRAGAWMLCEMSTASCFAMRSVVHALVAPLLQLCTSLKSMVRTPSNRPLQAVAVASVEALVLLLSACSGRAGHPIGTHPFELYSANILGLLLDCTSTPHCDATHDGTEVVLAIEEGALQPLPSMPSCATSTSHPLQVETGRLAAVRGMCALLTSLPCFFLTQGVMSQVIARFVAMIRRDPDPLVKVGCLDGLCAIAERDGACASYATGLIPAYMSVLDNCIAVEASSSDVCAADMLNIANVLGALVVLAPLPSFWPRVVAQLLHRAVVKRPVENACDGWRRGSDVSTRGSRQCFIFRQAAPSVTIAVLKTLAAMLHRITLGPTFATADQLWDVGRDVRYGVPAADCCSSHESYASGDRELSASPSTLWLFVSTLIRAIGVSVADDRGCVDAATPDADDGKGRMNGCGCARGDILRHTFVCMCAIPCLRLLRATTMYASPVTQRRLIGAVIPLLHQRRGHNVCWCENINVAAGTVIAGAVHPTVLLEKEHIFVMGAQEGNNGRRCRVLCNVLRSFLRVAIYSDHIQRNRACTSEAMPSYDGAIANTAAACCASIMNKLPGSHVFDLVMSNACIVGSSWLLHMLSPLLSFLITVQLI